ncbi:MAG: ribonuclease R [Planctomycetaceae bacterium]|nr:MAG: ribonuclease R [Planctomycetaceae bacterium]
MSDLATLILNLFQREPQRGWRRQEVSLELGIPPEQRLELRRTLKALVKQGVLHRDTGKRYKLAATDPPSGPPAVLPELPPTRRPTTWVGTVRRNPRGTGLFYPDPEPTADTASSSQPLAVPEPWVIAAGDMQGALTGDIVRVLPLARRDSRGRRYGRVVDIVKRARTSFVGTYHVSRGRGWVVVDGGLFDAPVLVGDASATGVRPQDKVVFEMLQWPQPRACGQGVITRVLGPHGAPGVDTLSIIHEFALPLEFPEEVWQQARECVQRFDPHHLQGRRDLTAQTIVTIDPIDARDFDDAISLELTPQGHWQLGVHIADVAWFVPIDSPLDLEARRRGNSVYLPDRVIPMFPELLSNGLASLQQDQVRYTVSVFLEFSPEGEVLAADFARSAIKVTHRFTYEQVQELITGGKGPRGLTAPVRELIHRMHRLAMLLRQRRLAAGALDLQMPEVKLELDEHGAVSGAAQVLHLESHQIIEEFMLAANIAVARALSAHHLPYLHRVHATPDEAKLRELGEFVRGLGIKAKPWLGRHELQRVLSLVRGKPLEYAVSYALLRSLRQAEYSPADIEHYALNEPLYCHVHQPHPSLPPISSCIDNCCGCSAAETSSRQMSQTELSHLGQHCSFTERRADQAERELIKVKLLEHLSSRIGLRMHATITGVESFGIFCQGVELPAEGLLPVTRLPPDMYDFDRVGHSLIGRRHGWKFRLGATLQVEVAAVDLERRLLEWNWVKPR